MSGADGACSHIAALLFAVEELARRKVKQVPTEQSKTSKSMEWNKPPRKVVHPAPVADIQFMKPVYDPNKKNSHTI